MLESGRTLLMYLKVPGIFVTRLFVALILLLLEKVVKVENRPELLNRKN